MAIRGQGANVRAFRVPKPSTVTLTLDVAGAAVLPGAWPILKKHGIPATFFLPTGFIGTDRVFWADRLDYAVQHLASGQESVTVGPQEYPVRGDDRHARGKLFWQLKGECMALGQDRGEQAVDAIEELATSKLTDFLSQNADWARFMTWEHVRVMQTQGAAFGSHTVEHGLLDKLPLEDVKNELRHSKAEIERRTGSPCSFLVYPRGQHNKHVARIAREVGYAGGLTTVERTAQLGDPAMTLPRIGVPSRSLRSADLLARVNGLSRAMFSARTALRRKKKRAKPTLKVRKPRVNRSVPL